MTVLSPKPAAALSPNALVALAWARQGFPVFPCRSGLEPGGKPKTPIGRWQNETTTDEATILRWWSLWPNALVGLRPLGLVVIDCDRAKREGANDGVVAWTELGLRHGFDGVSAMSVDTPSGGEHHYFRQPSGLLLGNSTGALPRGIDVRGNTEGYVIAPGSVMPDGRAYRYRSGPDLLRSAPVSALPELPPAAVGLIRSKATLSPVDTNITRLPDPVRPPPPLPKSWADLDLTNVRIWTGESVWEADDCQSMDERRGRALLTCCADELAAVQPGGRGQKAHAISYRVGRWVGSGAIAYPEALQALVRACERNGLSQKDGAARVQTAVARALTRGAQKPVPLPPLSSDLSPLLEGQSLLGQEVDPLEIEPDAPECASRADTRWRTWGDAPAAPREMLVKGVLPRRGVAQLVAAQFTGKSALALRLAAHIASGEPFFGSKVSATGGTLWFAFEAEDEMQPRLEALRCEGLIGSTAPVAWIADDLVALLSPEGEQRFRVDVAEGRNRLARAFDVPLRLIVIDTAAASAGWTDENSNAEGQRYMCILSDIAKEFDCLVLCIDHLGKAGAERGTRGSSAKDGAADARLMLTTESGTLMLTLDKLRGGKKGPVGAFRLRSIQLGLDEDGDPQEAVIAEPLGVSSKMRKPPGAGELRILDAVEELKKGGATIAREALRAAYLAKGGNPESFRRDLRKAEAAGFLELKDAEANE
ncbi:bifunctional DNA primase/polymerase [Methylobacterium durans]|uniref:DNA primase/polymerase bifunctional N-terminal domain-containing protein n=1 Tax=Methylobacterium durans TaxID=2202825 RepID=A0A2U8WB52_9HYPH|nr:bifunctional DNA primase/polymerase [Methylobacterium durans]AWN43269.1 hypothetical protein DK389_25655 [Methylobacterium durans]